MAGKSKLGKARRYRKSKLRRGRKASNVAEQASLSVKRSIAPVGSQIFTTNSIYSLEAISLSQFDRAVNVAKAYQFYRIKHVKLTIKMPFDTYAINYTTFNSSYSRPDMYHMIDKAGVLGNATTLEQLKQMGARPRACDNKPTSVSWTPSVLTETDGLAGGIPSAYKISPWLNTTSQTVPHRGVFWYLDQLINNIPPTVFPYTAELEVQFEFKAPLWQQNPPTEPFQTLVDGVRVLPLDNSSDGVEDGRDGRVLAPTPA